MVRASGLRAVGLTETARRAPPPLPNKTHPTFEEMSHEREVGPSPSGRPHSIPLSTTEFQHGKTVIPSKEFNWVRKQCCVRCNSNASEACQGAKTYHWHGPAAVFPSGPIHPSVTVLLVPFGGRMGTTPLTSDEDKRGALLKIRPESKWCTPAPKGSGAPMEVTGAASITEPSVGGQQPLDRLIEPLLGGTEDFRSDETAMEDLVGAADATWFRGRTRLASTYGWSTFSQSHDTDILKCLIAAILNSPDGRMVSPGSAPSARAPREIPAQGARWTTPPHTPWASLSYSCHWVAMMEI